MSMKTIIFTALVAAMLFSAGSRAQEQPQDQSPERKAYVERIRLAVEEICYSMKPYMERPDKLRSVSVMDIPEINAYADDKGNVVFFMGMINFVRNEHELAAVCGHEMAHLSAQHIKRSIGRSILATVAQVALGGTLGDVAGSALYTKQSRSHERESDDRGTQYMWAAGYDPQAIWKFWMAMNNAHEQGNSVIERYFSTHPVNGERIENLKVHLVRTCKANPALAHCDDILANEHYVNLFNAFEAR